MANPATEKHHVDTLGKMKREKRRMTDARIGATSRRKAVRKHHDFRMTLVKNYICTECPPNA